MNFFRALLHPDKEELEEESRERRMIASAANLLQVGEFQFLQLAYREWYGRNLPKADEDSLFDSYMLRNEVPFWARHYARKISDQDKRGGIDDRNPAFHIYDSDYRTSVPNGLRKFITAVAVLTAVIGGCLILAEMSVTSPAGPLPPYLDVDDLRPNKTPLSGS